MRTPLFIFALLFVFGCESDGPKTGPSRTDAMTNVKQHIRSTLKNPESYERGEWGEITPISDSTFVIYHKYTAKNSIGGTVAENHLFYLKKDGSVYDVKENN